MMLLLLLVVLVVLAVIRMCARSRRWLPRLCLCLCLVLAPRDLGPLLPRRALLRLALALGWWLGLGLGRLEARRPARAVAVPVREGT